MAEKLLKKEIEVLTSIFHNDPNHTLEEQVEAYHKRVDNYYKKLDERRARAKAKKLAQQNQPSN